MLNPLAVWILESIRMRMRSRLGFSGWQNLGLASSNGPATAGLLQLPNNFRTLSKESTMAGSHQSFDRKNGKMLGFSYRIRS